MAMRVATFHQTSSVLQMAMANQARLAQVQEQESSGLVSTDYAGLGSNSGTVVDLSVSVSRSNARINSAETCINRGEAIASVLGDISDLLTNMRSAISATSTEDEIADLKTQTEAALADMASLINTQYQGRYLFSGSLTDTPAVDLTGYTATDLTTVNTDYYQADDYVQTARLSTERSIDYGVTGDNTGFEQALRSLSYIVNTSPLETDKLSEISDLIVSAQDAVIAQQSTTGTALNRLESFVASEEEFVASTEELATNLTSVDIAAAAVEAKNLETQLEASYSALNVMINLSLLDHLDL